MSVLEVDLPLSPEETSAFLRRAVEKWGGVWSDEGSKAEEFTVPTRAGIREGYTQLRPAVEETVEGCRLRLSVEGEDLKVNTGATFVLLMGAVGGILVVLWPLHAALLSLAPAGAVLALVAWLLVASRFRSYGPEELLRLVAELAAESAEGEPEAGESEAGESAHGESQEPA